MNTCKGYAAGRIWLQVALVEGRGGKGADKKPHGPGRMFVFQWGMTLGYWARAWPLNTSEQGKAADPYLSPFDFLFIIHSIHFSCSLAFHPLLTLHLSLSQPLSLSIIFLWGTVRFLSAPSECHHQSFRLMTVLNGSSETALCGVWVSGSKENVCVCGRSVGLWCLLICFHSKLLQTVCEIQAATRANCSLPQTQLRNLCILPSKACIFSQNIMYVLSMPCANITEYIAMCHTWAHQHTVQTVQGWCATGMNKKCFFIIIYQFFQSINRKLYIKGVLCCIFFFCTLKRRAACGEMCISILFHCCKSSRVVVVVTVDSIFTGLPFTTVNKRPWQEEDVLEERIMDG